jgi:hypothetical protein
MSKTMAIAARYEELGRGLFTRRVRVAVPVHGAILDGRYQAERQRTDVLDPSTKRPGHRPAA